MDVRQALGPLVISRSVAFDQPDHWARFVSRVALAIGDRSICFPSRPSTHCFPYRLTPRTSATGSSGSASHAGFCTTSVSINLSCGCFTADAAFVPRHPSLALVPLGSARCSTS